MEFEITSGNPTPEELAAINAVMAQHYWVRFDLRI